MKDYVKGLITGVLLAAVLIGQQAHASFSPSVVKTIQNDTVTIAAGSASGTDALGTAVTHGKSLIVPGGCTTGNGAGTNGVPYYAHVVLTDATTVTATRTTSDGDDSTVCSYAVIEFY